jgi:hypothetical protein
MNKDEHYKMIKLIEELASNCEIEQYRIRKENQGFDDESGNASYKEGLSSAYRHCASMLKEAFLKAYHV